MLWSEFAQDHIPGAINLAVLNDQERAEVGTIYVQDSPFKARKLGAALVAQNAAVHLKGPLAEMDGGWMPLVYCWRGGQRSGSFASILSQIGWRADVVEGGYRAYRRLVVRALYEDPFIPSVYLIDGNTGTAKTDILKQFEALGGQVIDLEGLAHHRGSLFGGFDDDQPSQKSFEGAEDPARLGQVIDKLKSFYAADRILAWKEMSKSGAFEALAASLMEVHYDPRYRKGASCYQKEIVLNGLNPDDIRQAAQGILEFLD